MGDEITDLLKKVNKGYETPLWSNEILFESPLESLEPLYFWIIDFTQALGFDLKKLNDNFTATPGSNYFADLGQRATKMQEESIKIMGYVNTITKSILNLIYSIKEFELVLKEYENANSPDNKTKEIGILSLKQRWISMVDAKRGMGSIDNLAHQYGFTLLRPAFMAAASPEAVDNMDLNDMIKRLLKPRVSEFLEWVKLSGVELKHRFNIEKSYLKNQKETLKLYTEWVKPYLRAAEELRMIKGQSSSPAELVSIFNTMILELNLMGISKKPFDIEEAIYNKFLPKEFKNKKNIRKVYKVIFVTFNFRTFPTQASMHSGRVRINFKAYALNEDELFLFEKYKEKKDQKDILAITNLTEETLKELQEDIDKYTKPEEKPEEPKEEGMFEGILTGFKETVGFKEKKKEKTEGEIKKEEEERFEMLDKNRIPLDSYEESVVRILAENESAGSCFKIYDIFKKSRGMASFPNPFDEPDVINRLREIRAQIKADLEKKQREKIK